MESRRPKSVNCNTAINTKGFTLIEVMVALAIIAITLGALLSTSGSQARNTGYLKHKSIAHWVASYELTKLQVENKLPSAGDEKGSTEMAGNEWFWVRTTKETDDEEARRVEYRIYADKNLEQQLTLMSGLVVLRQ